MDNIINNIKLRKIQLLVLLAFSLLFFLGSIYYIHLVAVSSSKNAENLAKENNKKSRDMDMTKNAIDTNLDYKSAVDLLSEGKKKEAIPLLEKARSQEKDNSIKSIIDITLAENYIALGEILVAVQNLKRISETVEYPKTTRAAALTTAIQQYSGTRNKDFLLSFDLQGATTTNDILEKSHRQILSIYPVGLSVAYVAKIDMKKHPEKAKSLYEEAIATIDEDIRFQEKGIGSNRIVPNIMLAKANLMIEGEKKGYNTSDQVIAMYKFAIQVSKNKLQDITAQFGMLLYLNYLGSFHLENEKDIISLSQVLNLERDKFTPMVKGNLSSGSLNKNWPGIYKVVTNPKYEKYFKDINEFKFKK